MAEEFFVGYLPVPFKLRRMLLVTASCMVLAMAAIGIGVASTQNDPGEGKWNLNQLDAVDGVLAEHPYPMIHTEHGTVLLVSEGKRGAASRFAGMNGKHVTLHGHMLTRGNLKLLELDESAPTIDSANALPPSIVSTEAIKLTGEIIDPKCFSGAMKPGEGKTHKACAVLCIRGGIPPVFLDTNGNTLVLVNSNGDGLFGESLNSVLPYVGDFVEVRAQKGTVGGLATLHIESITRR